MLKFARPVFIKLGLFLSALLLSASISADASQAGGEALLEMAKTKRAPRYEYAMQNHAEIGYTADGKSFYLFWAPENYSPETTPVIVTIHGHDGWAVEDFYVWHSILKERGYAMLAVQWWLGEGESIKDYLTPQEIYRVIDDVFQKKRIQAPALLHGFSRGSTNTYALAAMDVSTGHHYFKLFIANAGKANSNYPPTAAIEKGQFGENPLGGTRWITYAGGQDTNPDRDGIPGMRQAGEWIERYGGKVVLAIEDPNSGHGGFHRNPDNTNKALDEFEKIRYTL